MLATELSRVQGAAPLKVRLRAQQAPRRTALTLVTRRRWSWNSFERKCGRWPLSTARRWNKRRPSSSASSATSASTWCAWPYRPALSLIRDAGGTAQALQERGGGIVVIVIVGVGLPRGQRSFAISRSIRTTAHSSRPERCGSRYHEQRRRSMIEYVYCVVHVKPIYM
jgi:hypothetical protein